MPTIILNASIGMIAELINSILVFGDVSMHKWAIYIHHEILQRT